MSPLESTAIALASSSELPPKGVEKRSFEPVGSSWLTNEKPEPRTGCTGFTPKKGSGEERETGPEAKPATYASPAESTAMDWPLVDEVNPDRVFKYVA